jgi:hypothetical protein
MSVPTARRFDPARERQAVLFANEVFYRAFTDKDLAAMDRIWARRESVACIHPGWPILTGRDSVMESWRRILSGPAPASVPVEPDVVFADETALVVCLESLDRGKGWCAATNVFAREDGEWRLVLHQAGPAPKPAAPAAGAPARAN